MNSFNYVVDNSNSKYRYWPIYWLALIKALYLGINGIALPNFLLFNLNKSASIIGIIISVSAIAYLLSNIMGKSILSKLGIRRSIIVASIISPFLMTSQLFYQENWFLILTRSLDGLLLTLFWPNLQFKISDWKKTCSEEQSQRYFKNYSISWNMGLIIGYLIGFLFVLIWKDDFIALIVSCVLAFFNIPIAFRVEKDNVSCIDLEDPYHENLEPVIIEQESIVHLESNQLTQKMANNTPLIAFPILFFTLGCMVYASYRALFNFAYPFFLELNNQPSYWYYIQIFLNQIPQLWAISWIHKKTSVKKLDYFFFSLGAIIIFSLLLLIYNSLWLFSVILVFTSWIYGMMYGITTQIMLDYGTHANSNKYVLIYEICISIGMSTGPLFGGYLIDWKLQSIFLYQMLITCASMLILSFKYKKTKLKIESMSST